MSLLSHSFGTPSPGMFHRDVFLPHFVYITFLSWKGNSLYARMIPGLLIQKLFKGENWSCLHVCNSSMQQRYNWERTHVILFIFPGFGSERPVVYWQSQTNTYLMELAKVKVHTSRTQVDSKVFINLHAWNHCPWPALSRKWLENYMEPHASSEILSFIDKIRPDNLVESQT